MWKIRDDQLVTLFSTDEDEIHSENGETDFWKRKLLNKDDFKEFKSNLNKSFGGQESNRVPLDLDENTLTRRGKKASDKKMPLVPRKPH